MAELLWTYSDQQTIKPISPNFPQPEFSQIAEEVQVEDLQKILGFEFYQDIVQNPTTTANAALLNGGTYTYNSTQYFYEGLKHVLAYFFYARYIRQSFKKDTYGGFVGKEFEESRKLNNGDESNLYNINRRLAFKYWEECLCFIKANPSDYPYFYTDPPPRSCWPSDRYNQSFCI